MSSLHAHLEEEAGGKALPVLRGGSSRGRVGGNLLH